MKMVFDNLFKPFFKNVWMHTRNMSETKLSTENAASKLADKISSMSANELVKNTVKVSNWNKRLLVFAGKYKNMAEIPDILPFETVDKARNKVRIKVANIMMVMTLAGCLFMVFSGKKAAEAGESVSKMNLDWHREYNEQAKREAEALEKKK